MHQLHELAGRERRQVKSLQALNETVSVTELSLRSVLSRSKAPSQPNNVLSRVLLSSINIFIANVSWLCSCNFILLAFTRPFDQTFTLERNAEAKLLIRLTTTLQIENLSQNKGESRPYQTRHVHAKCQCSPVYHGDRTYMHHGESTVSSNELRQNPTSRSLILITRVLNSLIKNVNFSSIYYN